MATEFEYIEVDLYQEQKKLILKLATMFVQDEVTQADLKNGRKKWIRIRKYAISEIAGELSYYFNRNKNAGQSEFLDELIEHLESILLQN